MANYIINSDNDGDRKKFFALIDLDRLTEVTGIEAIPPEAINRRVPIGLTWANLSSGQYLVGYDDINGEYTLALGRHPNKLALLTVDGVLEYEQDGYQYKKLALELLERLKREKSGKK